MRIKTLDLLREYILRQMGSPTIKVELTEDQLNDCIYKAIDRYSKYAYDGTIDGTLMIDLEPNENGELIFVLPDNVIAIPNLKASSVYSTFINIPAGYTLAMNPITLSMLDSVSNIDVQSMTAKMASMSTLRKLFDVEPNFSFNHNTKILQFFEQPTSSVVLMEIAMEYEPGEIDNIYNDQWIKKRAQGEAMVLWSNVTGKYSSNLVNGTAINYNDIESKGKELIQETEDELFEIGEPLGVHVF